MCRERKRYSRARMELRGIKEVKITSRRRRLKSRDQHLFLLSFPFAFLRSARTFGYRTPVTDTNVFLLIDRNEKEEKREREREEREKNDDCSHERTRPTNVFIDRYFPPPPALPPRNGMRSLSRFRDSEPSSRACRVANYLIKRLEGSAKHKQAVPDCAA